MQNNNRPASVINIYLSKSLLQSKASHIITNAATYIKKVHLLFFIFVFCVVFLNSCGCSTAKLMTPPQETFFHPLNGTEHGSHPSLTTRDRELVTVLEVRNEPGDLNPRPLTPQSVNLPTVPTG